MEVRAHLPPRDPDPELARAIRYDGRPVRDPSANFCELVTQDGIKMSVPCHVPVLLDRHDPTNQIQGLEKRLLQKLPSPDPLLRYEFAAYVRRWVKENVPKVEVPPYHEWIANAPYPQHRKAELDKVHEALNGLPPTKKQSQTVNSFAKLEDNGQFKYLRWINSRSDAVKVHVGPAFHAIEAFLFSLPEFAKAYKKPGDLVNHIADAPLGLDYIQTDYTAFESHMTLDVLRDTEFQLYNAALKNCPALAKYIRDTIGGVNCLRTREGVSLTMKGRRMSGDMCTSLGNSFTNFMLAKFVAHKAGDNHPWLVVEGDDGLMGTRYGPVDDTLYGRLGFICKAVRVTDPGEAGFCGKIFGPDKQVIRDPVKFLRNFAWSDKALNAGNQVAAGLLRAKALSAAYETPHCPIIRAMADYAMAHCPTVKPRFVVDVAHAQPDVSTALPPQATTAATRELFSRVFGVPASAQIEAERLIRQGRFDHLYYLLPPLPHAYVQDELGMLG